MANALTAVRLALVLPIAAAFARPELLAPGVVALLLCVAIATDYLDGRVARMNGDGFGQGPAVRSRHGLPLRHRRTGGRRHGRRGDAAAAGLDPGRVWPVRRGFLRVASPAATARQLSRALERHPLFRAPRAHRGVAIALPGGLCVVPAAGGRSARVRAGGFDRGVRHRSRDDSGSISASIRLCRT